MDLGSDGPTSNSYSAASNGLLSWLLWTPVCSSVRWASYYWWVRWLLHTDKTQVYVSESVCFQRREIIKHKHPTVDFLVVIQLGRECILWKRRVLLEPLKSHYFSVFLLFARALALYAAIIMHTNRPIKHANHNTSSWHILMVATTVCWSSLTFQT